MYSTPDTGARSFDSEKYNKDAKKLKQQFFDTLILDPDDLNTRSIFYTAQSYKDYGNLEESAKWYNLYLKIKNTWIEEQYMCYLNLGNIYKSLKYDFKLIEKMYLSAIELINDRAEAYYNLGILYNQTNNQEYAYKLLLKAKNIKFEDSAKKYMLFLDKKCYENYILDELSVACYWTNKIEEGIKYLSQIIDDPKLDQNRLQDNMKHLTNKLNVFKI